MKKENSVVVPRPEDTADMLLRYLYGEPVVVSASAVEVLRNKFKVWRERFAGSVYHMSESELWREFLRRMACKSSLEQ